ncbi:hypothetical protein LCGC14_0947220 [marine sediment metagenome]|uniref:Transcription factor zinc-finger domain-containing protein n=1 Tax=marine sediment metagenome TaxID=412755 RepID=A0A0F9RPS7_9ZZZZ
MTPATTKFQCPRCKAQIIVEHHSDIEIEFCPACGLHEDDPVDETNEERNKRRMT